jgi:F-box and leucine-rich repeat protein 2/20
LPNLTTVNFESCCITDLGIRILSEGCRNLESIDISHCKNVTADGVLLLAKNSPKLKTFICKYSTVINDTSFKELAQRCPCLEHVSLQNCSVSEAAASFKMASFAIQFSPSLFCRV